MSAETGAPTPGAAPIAGFVGLSAAPGDLTPDPLVEALGWHMIDCPVCRTRARASCPEGRSLSDAAALATTIAYERRKGWRQ